MRKVTHFTHNKAARHSFLYQFLGDPHHHHQQLPFLQASNRNANFSPPPPHGKQLLVLTSFRGVCVCTLMNRYKGGDRYLQHEVMESPALIVQQK